jgi:hypothetical protein
MEDMGFKVMCSRGQHVLTFDIQSSFALYLFSMTQCLCRTLAQLEDEVALCEAQMESWSTNLQVMAAKERQYMQQSANYKVQRFCFLLEGRGGVIELCSLS